MRADATPGVRTGAAIAMLALALAAPAQAGTRLWLAGVNYESTRLVVPVIAVRASNDRGHEWNAWLTGWTLGADWSVAPTPRRRWRVELRATPVNADSSDYVYVNGRRDPAASFRAASIEGAAAIELTQTRRWTGRYRAILLYERIRDLPDAGVREFWQRPFVGAETVQGYVRVRSETRLGARWEGVKAEGAAQLYTGHRTWSRLRGSAGAGARVGPLFLSGRAAAFTGQSLNTVNAFLLGGSWDLAVPGLLTGYRYAEFRLVRAAIVGAGADLRLRGPWEVGVRGSYLDGRGLRRGGAAVQLMTIWQGAVVDAGVAWPDASTGATRGRAVVFATITAALVGR
jgi:hypothetical protein